jgi:hypothetical protein
MLKALVASNHCHVIVTTNIFIKTTARLLQENKGSRGGHNSLREMRVGSVYGRSFRRLSLVACDPKSCDNLI